MNTPATEVTFVPEIDLRGNKWVSGIPAEDQFISRELYRLLTIFAGSPALARRATSDQGGCVYSWSVRSFEYPEIGRILVSLAAVLRNDWDANPGRSKGNLEIMKQDPVVGVLIEDLSRPRKRKSLRIRDSFNKILHADTLNLERSKGPSIYDGYLRPRVHLYGELNAKQWKATIQIFDWAERVHTIS